jgi:hypothetical protein
MIARIAYSEAAPDKAGDTFRCPHGCVKAIGYWPSRQHAGEPRQFLASKFGTRPRFQESAQSFVSVQAIVSGPSLNDWMLTPREQATAEVESPRCNRTIAAIRRASSFAASRLFYPRCFAMIRISWQKPKLLSFWLPTQCQRDDNFRSLFRPGNKHSF